MLLAFKKTFIKTINLAKYNNLGVTYSHLGERDKAMKIIKKPLNLKIMQAYNNLATQYDDFGEYSVTINYAKTYNTILNILM